MFLNQNQSQSQTPSKEQQLKGAKNSILFAGIAAFLAALVIFIMATTGLSPQLNPLPFAASFVAVVVMIVTGILLLKSKSIVAAVVLPVCFIIQQIIMIASGVDFNRFVVIITILLITGITGAYQYAKLTKAESAEQSRQKQYIPQEPQQKQFEPPKYEPNSYQQQQYVPLKHEPKSFRPNEYVPLKQESGKRSQYEHTQYRNQSGNPQYNQSMRQSAGRQHGASYAQGPVYIPSIVLGIIAIALCWLFGIVSVVLGALGIMLSIRNKDACNMAPGLVLSLIGLILGVIMFVSFIIY